MCLAILRCLGFSVIGPVAGSLAALFQSIWYGAWVVGGSLFALFQSIAMGGTTVIKGLIMCFCHPCILLIRCCCNPSCILLKLLILGSVGVGLWYLYPYIVEDTEFGDWLEGAKNDTKDWFEGAKDDTSDSFEGAKDDTKDWIEGLKDGLVDIFGRTNSSTGGANNSSLILDSLLNKTDDSPDLF